MGNTRTNSPNTKLTAKQNTINKVAQNTRNSNDNSESDTPDKSKLSFTVIFGDSMVRPLKAGKCQVALAKLC